MLSLVLEQGERRDSNHYSVMYLNILELPVWGWRNKVVVVEFGSVGSFKVIDWNLPNSHIAI